MWFFFTRSKKQSGANIESFSFAFMSLFGVEFRSYWENICLLARISLLPVVDIFRATSGVVRSLAMYQNIQIRTINIVQRGNAVHYIVLV